MKNDFFKFLICPVHYSPLIRRENGLFCAQCNSTFAIKDGRVFFINPTENLLDKSSLKYKLNKNSWSKWRTWNFNFLKQYLEPLPKDRLLLDLGAGHATFRELTHKFESISADFFLYDTVDLIADISGKLPFQDNTFDVIILSNVLEHLPDPRLSLKECHRILKKGGVVLATIPFMVGLHQKPFDYSRMTHYMLHKILEDLRFDNFKIEAYSDMPEFYKNTNAVFFNSLVSSTETGNYPVSALLNITARLLRKANNLYMKVFWKLLSKAKNEDFPLGYGFMAQKSNV